MGTSSHTIGYSVVRDVAKQTGGSVMREPTLAGGRQIAAGLLILRLTLGVFLL